MQLIIRGELPEAPISLMRRLGYHFFTDPRSQETGFMRRLGSGHYPRFHAHLQTLAEGGVVIDLHLDMQQHSLSQRRHGLQNDDLVIQERERIKQYIVSLAK